MLVNRESIGVILTIVEDGIENRFSDEKEEAEPAPVIIGDIRKASTLLTARFHTDRIQMTRSSGTGVVEDRKQYGPQVTYVLTETGQKKDSFQVWKIQADTGREYEMVTVTERTAKLGLPEAQLRCARVQWQCSDRGTRSLLKNGDHRSRNCPSARP